MALNFVGAVFLDIEVPDCWGIRLLITGVLDLKTIKEVLKFVNTRLLRHVLDFEIIDY